MIFQDSEVDFSNFDLLRDILLTTSEVCAARKVRDGSSAAVLKISWHPPDTLAVKLNTFGASCGNTGIAGAGGLIRDASGRCLVGFEAHLGVCSFIVYELHACRLGLLLACQEGYRHVECELSAKVVL